MDCSERWIAIPSTDHLRLIIIPSCRSHRLYNLIHAQALPSPKVIRFEAGLSWTEIAKNLGAFRERV